MKNLLLAEYVKNKHKLLIGILFVSPLIMPLLFFIIELKANYKLRSMNVDNWLEFQNNCFISFSFLLFPLFICTVSAFFMQIEHKSNAWQKIFVLPVSRVTFYLTKFFYLLVYIYIYIFLFCIYLVILSAILAFVKDDFFNKSTINYFTLFITSNKLFLYNLGIITLQFALSLNIRNFITPILIGIILIVIAFIITSSWSGSIYFMYSYPIYFVRDIYGNNDVSPLRFLTFSKFISFSSILWAIFITFFSLKYYRMKK